MELLTRGCPREASRRREGERRRALLANKALRVALAWPEGISVVSG